MTEVETFEPKPISRDAIPEAIKKAEHYRLLNQPAPAESICLDVLETDPDNQEALVVLILAMTDQFERHESASRSAKEYLERLEDEYQRTYYRGLSCERHAQAFLGRSMSRMFAYDGFREAMDWYEKAQRIRPQNNDEAISEATARTTAPTMLPGSVLPMREPAGKVVRNASGTIYVNPHRIDGR